VLIWVPSRARMHARDDSYFRRDELATMPECGVQRKIMPDYMSRTHRYGCFHSFSGANSLTTITSDLRTNLGPIWAISREKRLSPLY
jgi:hypothetical protein